MDLFATDRERLAFLLETDAALDLDFETLEAQAKETVTDEASPAKRPKYITNYIGSKQKLVDWIWKHTPEGVGSVLDAFSGSAVVAYMYKTKGLRVLANDRLRYCYHAARAIVENRNVRLTDEELEALLADNAKAGSFIRDNFKGIFFAKGVHGLIDTIRANIEKLSGFKKDIALFALGKTCMSGKGGFGHFSSSTRYGKREDTPDEFKERFRKNVVRINALVFDNGKECKAYRKDVNGLLSEVRVDLAYFDPPYATEFSTTNYEKSYHFVEGLMTYWDGLTLVEGSKTKHYKTDHQTVSRTNAKEFFETFLGNAQHIPNWLISYRDHAYPNEREMRGIITTHGFEPAMRSRDHHYSITSRHGDASHAKERLFICKHGKGRSVKADAAAESMRSQAVWEETENEIRYRVMDPERFEPDSFRRKSLEGVDGVSIILGRLKKEFVPEGGNPRSMVLQAYRFARKTEKNPDGWAMEKAKEWIKEHESKETAAATMCAEEDLKVLAACHTSIPVELCFSEAGDLCTEALDFVKNDGDPQFTFVLCRAGTNKNGDHFTPDELAARYTTAVNKKIDLKHSQEFTDIVGGVVSADFIEDENGGRVECVGELFVSDSLHAQLAYKLIRRGIVTQVLMECDYEEGECSICGKRVQSKNDYCIHLRKHKGGAFQEKPVFEILHGVTFTGLGLLDRKGADENARITQVASERGEVS